MDHSKDHDRNTSQVTVGAAQRPGTEPPYADGLHVHRKGDRVCAVVVNGAGSVALGPGTGIGRSVEDPGIRASLALLR
ncbi:hypothetical protein ACIBUR_03985 [Streptomyces anulatus]